MVAAFGKGGTITLVYSQSSHPGPERKFQLTIICKVERWGNNFNEGDGTSGKNENAGTKSNVGDTVCVGADKQLLCRRFFVDDVPLLFHHRCLIGGGVSYCWLSLWREVVWWSVG